MHRARETQRDGRAAASTAEGSRRRKSEEPADPRRGGYQGRLPPRIGLDSTPLVSAICPVRYDALLYRRNYPYPASVSHVRSGITRGYSSDD